MQSARSCSLRMRLFFSIKIRTSRVLLFDKAGFIFASVPPPFPPPPWMNGFLYSGPKQLQWTRWRSKPFSSPLFLRHREAAAEHRMGSGLAGQISFDYTHTRPHVLKKKKCTECNRIKRLDRIPDRNNPAWAPQIQDNMVGKGCCTSPLSTWIPASMATTLNITVIYTQIWTQGNSNTFVELCSYFIMSLFCPLHFLAIVVVCLRGKCSLFLVFVTDY